MKAKVYDINGKVVKEVDMPKVFAESVRPDLIKRAVLAEQSEKYQPKGNFKRAGMQTSAKYRGVKDAYASLKNRGQPMLPREVKPNGRWGKVRRVPNSKGGRRAHPPNPNKNIKEIINPKEHFKALKSALSATTNTKMVKSRGHNINIEAPIVMDSSFNGLKKTKKVYDSLLKIISDDLERSRKGRKKITTRKRGKYVPRSALLIVPEDSVLLKSAKNIPGIDVTTPKKLTVELLAPGTQPGRLTLVLDKVLPELDKLEYGMFRKVVS